MSLVGNERHSCLLLGYACHTLYSLTPGNSGTYKIASQYHEKVGQQTFVKQQNECLHSHRRAVTRVGSRVSLELVSLHAEYLSSTEDENEGIKAQNEG